MASLPDNLVDIIVGQLNIFLANACLLGVFLGGNINVDQAAAQGFRAFAILPLVRLVNNDGKLAPAERLHIFLGKQELLDRADDDALFVVDSLRLFAVALCVLILGIVIFSFRYDFAA